jgi:membrane protease YdiL (CAAX protease family)
MRPLFLPQTPSYWRATRAPRYSLTFAFPLLAVYELLAFTLSGHAISGVRNGADVLLKSLFVEFGGRDGLIAFGGLLLGTGAVLIWRDLKRGGSIRPRYFLFMAAESLVYALAFGMVVGMLTGILLGGIVLASAAGIPAPVADLSLAAQLVISLGAGIYEELLFRVLLVGSLAWLGRAGFGWTPGWSGVFATLLGALIFSAFHYIGPYGDPLELPSFTFRTLAGLVFSALYLTRGLGVTAWTHALYDVFFALA